MRRRGIQSATTGLLWLCAMVAGCAQFPCFPQRDRTPTQTAEKGADQVKIEKEATPQRRSDVRQANFEEAAPIPAAGPVSLPEEPGNSSDPPAQRPEEVPLPQGVPAAEPAGNAGTSVADNPPAKAESGKPITLHVDDLDVRKALEILSRQADVSILVSPGVAGNVTLDLRDKTVDQILDAIARLCQLNVQRRGGMVFVSSKSESPEGEDGKLPVRVYHLDYVKSADLEAMIKPLLSPSGTVSSSPVSEVGIESDLEKAGGNSMAGGDVLIVQDYENVLKSIDRVVAQIDVQPVQVLIEAVIVSVKLNKGMELGVNFALLDNAQNALGVVGSGAAINAAAGFSPASVVGNVANVVTSGTDNKTTVGTDPTEIKNVTTSTSELSSNGFMRSGFTTDDNGVKFGWTGRNTSGFIKALEGMGETKVLACPRLLVVNKQRAEIQLGDRLGYKTVTQTQTSTVEKVEFMDVGTLLRLRPFISSDGMIRMEIHPERSSGKLDINDVPQTNTAQVTTNILVPDGATILIGGLMDHEVLMEYQGLPFLSRLPWIGSLFRETITSRQNKELIVILTPHIWRPEMPGALNHLGPPRSLGLESRVSTLPKGTGDDPPSLYAIPPDAAPADVTPPPRVRVGQKKPKRQTPSDFYALPRNCPSDAVETPPPGAEAVPDAPMPPQ